MAQQRMETAEPTIAIDPSHLIARAAVYRLLGRLWRNEVDESLLHALLTAPLCDAFMDAGGVLSKNDGDDQTLADLAVDFCQLFLGPRGHLPPYQSVWVDGHFHGTATATAQSRHETLDLPQPDGMPDHFGEQLAAMGVIVERLATRTSVAASDLHVAQEYFRQQLTWADRLCKIAAERAQTEFYRSVAAMTHRFLTTEAVAWLVVD